MGSRAADAGGWPEVGRGVHGGIGVPSTQMAQSSVLAVHLAGGSALYPVVQHQSGTRPACSERAEGWMLVARRQTPQRNCMPADPGLAEA